ncbi:ABC transporter permease [Sodalis sp. RH21]|uniref:ABC transporter permease n=1 Tax=unclassified Sodalis (in: enterobacteria) TaxID=2636512 RepID=UPI0039B57D00
MSLRETWVKARYNLLPTYMLGELLTKRWIDNVIPVAFLLLILPGLNSVIPDFFNLSSLSDTGRQLGEFSLVAMGMGIVMLGGGIDLSVGAIFALCAFSAVASVYLLQLPLALAFLLTLGVGALAGAFNGVLIGYLRLRAFLTTLVSFILIRTLFDILAVKYATQIQLASVDNAAWDFIGDGGLGPFPVSLIAALAVAIGLHLLVSRGRFGWHIQAVGGSRRSAFNTGIAVKKTVFMTYLISGICCAVGGFLIAARMSGIGPGTGSGLEIMALTACVVGGNSLGGGRGSVVKAAMGAVIVLLLTNGLIRLGLPSGSTQMVLGAVLIVAVFLDIRWLKNRHRVLATVYVAPIYTRMAAGPSALPADNGRWALNDRLAQAETIGLGQLEGPEDVILDAQDHLYCGTRHGEVIRYFAPDYQRSEVFAHTGGFPLGLALDRDQSLTICVGAMGLYRVSPQREVTQLSTETRRSWRSIVDDARLRDPNDCDIAPDGRVFFTDSTTRYDAHEWALDSIESRPTGRLLCYYPASGKTETLLSGLRYANGVCIAHDGQSLFLAESWACRVHRYWFDGPEKGRLDTVIADMPGYPDNINRASDGNYWMAWLGMRTPTFDLALRHPGMRRRMTRRLVQDEWLFPNINTGGVLKFTPAGEIVEVLGNLGGLSHPMVTSMREHKGYLYIGGILNNRIGRFKLTGADPHWTGYQSYWGSAR